MSGQKQLKKAQTSVNGCAQSTTVHHVQMLPEADGAGSWCKTPEHEQVARTLGLSMQLMTSLQHSLDGLHGHDHRLTR